jgi:hypothetical protein
MSIDLSWLVIVSTQWGATEVCRVREDLLEGKMTSRESRGVEPSGEEMVLLVSSWVSVIMVMFEVVGGVEDTETSFTTY